MQHTPYTDESFEHNSKHDRKKKLETQRRIRDLKEQQQLKKDLDYYEFDDYEN